MAQDTFFNLTSELLLQGKKYNLDQPRIMGILNVNPDSFYDGGKYGNEREWLGQTEKMIAEGADFIDIGGISSRPGSIPISEEEELRRLLPVIQSIRKQFGNALISVDTFRSNIARIMLNEGAVIINDISGGNWDENMYPTVAGFNSTIIIMHNRGTFDKMHAAENYKNIGPEVKDELRLLIGKAKNSGVSSLLVDPGFGFAKNTAQNFELLDHLEELNSLNYPVLCGISRKSMIWKTLNSKPENALNGTTALHMICLQKGAKILRVHDVKEAKEVITLYSKFKSYGKER